MPKRTRTELPATMAIAGLLKEKPNQTVAEVREGLAERFPSAGWHRTTARTVLPQMAHGGHGRPRVRRTYEAPHGQSELDRYELTRAGEDVFRAWMYAVPSGTPTLREALFGRIELCQLEDVPELIRIAREEELIARDLYSAASVKLKQRREDHDERRGASDLDDAQQQLQSLREVLLYVTPSWWGKRHEFFKEVRHQLEKIAEDAGLDFGVFG
jgi:hypothetical protein